MKLEDFFGDFGYFLSQIYPLKIGSLKILGSGIQCRFRKSNRALRLGRIHENSEHQVNFRLPKSYYSVYLLSLYASILC